MSASRWGKARGTTDERDRRAGGAFVDGVPTELDAAEERRRFALDTAEVRRDTGEGVRRMGVGRGGGGRRTEGGGWLVPGSGSMGGGIWPKACGGSWSGNVLVQAPSGERERGALCSSVLGAARGGKRRASGDCMPPELCSEIACAVAVDSGVVVISPSSRDEARRDEANGDETDGGDAGDVAGDGCDCGAMMDDFRDNIILMRDVAAAARNQKRSFSIFC